MSLPTRIEQTLKGFGDDQNPQSIYVSDILWTVFGYYGNIIVKEYDGSFFQISGVDAQYFILTNKKKEDHTPDPDRIWLWILDYSYVLKLYEMEFVSGEDPIVYDVTTILTDVATFAVCLQLNEHTLKIGSVNTGSPEKLKISIYEDVKTAVPITTQYFDWDSANVDQLDVFVENAFNIVYPKVGTPPNIYTIDYDLTIPQIIDLYYSGYVYIEWDTVIDAEVYILERSINDEYFSPEHTTVVYSGSSTSTVDTHIPEEASTYYYRVKISQPSMELESDWSDVESIYVTVPPLIITDPLDQSVFVGQTASFSITASGTEPLNYQWQKKPSGGSFSDIIGATSSSYTTPPTVSGDDDSEFRCVVTNVAGSATSASATLTVTFQVVPDFVGVPRTGTAPLIVDYTNLTEIPEGYTALYLWRFGDGSTSSDENPTHTYMLRGRYTVSLRVRIILYP